MNKFLKNISNSVGAFSRDEEGAQVVEYALIIAVVSIALVVALGKLSGKPSAFDSFITRVGTCLAANSTCA